MMFKNLNQFKNNIKLGQKVKVINKVKDKVEDRIVVHIQTNSIGTGIEITKEEYQKKSFDWIGCNNVTMLDDKYYTKIFLDYQKAKNMKFENNTVSFLTYETTLNNGKKVVVPTDKLEVGESWLELVFSEE